MLHKMLRKIHRLGRELSATGLHPPKMALVSWDFADQPSTGVDG
jgi:hypothetical protein